MAKGQHVLDKNSLSWAVAAAQPDVTSAVGTPAAGTVDVGAAFAQATLNNNFATLVTELNKIRAALRDAGILAS